MQLASVPRQAFRSLNEIMIAEAEAALQYRYQAATLIGSEFQKTIQQFSVDLRQVCQTIADHICNIGGSPRTDLKSPESYIDPFDFCRDYVMEESLLNQILDFINWCRTSGFSRSIPLAKSLAAVHAKHMRVLELLKETAPSTTS